MMNCAPVRRSAEDSGAILPEKIAGRIRAQAQAPILLGIPLDSTLADVPLMQTIAEIRADERALLAQRQHARSSADTDFWIFTAVAIGAILLIIWWAYTARPRYVLERNESDFKIRNLNARLSDQVAAIRGLNATLEEPRSR